MRKPLQASLESNDGGSKVKKKVKMKRILLPIIAIGVLLLSACGTSTAAPPEAITITPPPETITITITPPPETVTITPPPETITITVTPPPPEPPAQIIEHLSPQDAFALIQDNQDNPNFAIIDVRTPEEVAGGYIEGAINIDFYADTFEAELGILDKSKVYLIYCRTGGRSGPTLPIMEELGFLEVYDIEGGILAWIEEELPVIVPEQQQERPPSEDPM